MDWENLKQNLCPKCGKELQWITVAGKNHYQCHCGFSISEKRFKEIINEMVNQGIEKDTEEYY